MADEKAMTEQDFHRKMAVGLFNGTWDLMEKPGRSIEEDFTMLHCAHASRYHWECRQDHTQVHIERGEWQISRVYTLLGRGEPALHHAKRCLDICVAEGIGDWDIAFAHEAVARASAASGDAASFQEHFRAALELGALISDKGDRDYFFKDLRAGNWFGMTPNEG